jgi:hypothetical protein
MRTTRQRVLRPGWSFFERISINLSHFGLVSGLCQGSREFSVLEPWNQSWHQPCCPI